MKPINILSFISVFIVIIITYFVYLERTKPVPIYLKIEKPTAISSTQADREVIRAVKKINKKNAAIESLICSPEIKFNYINFKLDSNLFLKKDTFFRLLVTSRAGKELDAGSNEQNFWFWSRRSKPRTLYYSEHDQLHKTMLKTALNPKWMMESMNVSEIKLAKIDEFLLMKGGRWLLLENQKDTLNRPMTKVTLIDIKKLQILGHYLYDCNDRMTASAEITKFQHIENHTIPKNLAINWYDEGIHMDWLLNKPLINTEIDSLKWKMPKYNRMLNMSEN